MHDLMHYFREEKKSNCKLQRIPGTVEIEGAGPSDGEEAKNMLVKMKGLLHRSANKRDVIQRPDVEHSSLHIFYATTLTL